MSLVMGMRASEIVSRVVRDLDDDGTLLWIPDSKTEAGRRTLQVPELLQPYLGGWREGQSPEAKLFGQHWRDWVRKWVQRICKAAGVPKVTAHGMRGLHSTLAVENGVSAHVVAASLGHESSTTTIAELREARGGGGRAAESRADRARRVADSPPEFETIGPRIVSNRLSDRKNPNEFRGAERDRTVGLLSAIQALSQLSYSPKAPDVRRARATFYAWRSPLQPRGSGGRRGAHQRRALGGAVGRGRMVGVGEGELEALVDAVLAADSRGSGRGGGGPCRPSRRRRRGSRGAALRPSSTTRPR